MKDPINFIYCVKFLILTQIGLQSLLIKKKFIFIISILNFENHINNNYKQNFLLYIYIYILERLIKVKPSKVVPLRKKASYVLDIYILILIVHVTHTWQERKLSSLFQVLSIRIFHGSY